MHSVVSTLSPGYPLHRGGPAFVTLAVVSVLMFSYMSGMNEYPKFLVAALLGIFVCMVILGHRAFVLSLEYRLLAAWVFLCTAAAIVAMDPDRAFAKLVTLLTVYPMAFALTQFVIWYKSPACVWSGIVIGALAMCYLSTIPGLVQMADDRLTGTAGNANELGYVLVVATIFLLYAMFSARSMFVRIGAAALATVPIYFIPLTGSKQAVITLVVATTLYVFLKLDLRNAATAVRSLVVVALFVSALGASLSYFASTPGFERFADFVDSVTSGELDKSGTTGESTRDRYLFYVNGLDIASRHPVLGVGLDNFRVALSRYPGFMAAPYSHSNYIELLTGTGYTGFILYFSIYLVLARRLLRLRKRPMTAAERHLYHASIVLFCTIVVSDLAMVSYYDKIAWIVLSSLIASTLLLERGIGVSRRAPHAAFV